MATPIYRAGTATAVAPVTAPPTTAAHFALYNTALAGGKSLSLMTVETFCSASAGAALIIQPYAHVSANPVAQMTGTVATAIQSLVPTGLPSVAAVASAVTITADSVWHPCGESANFGTGTTTIAVGTSSLVTGLYVIPPQGLFSLAIVCSAINSATLKCFVTWTEA